MPSATINGQKVLYLHIPKTGGSTVERFLEAHAPLRLKNQDLPGQTCSSQHLHAAALKNLGEFSGLDWTFTIVRHPVARVVSEYRYQMRKPRGLRARLSFSGWLTYALARRRLNASYRDNHFRAQHEFVAESVEVLRFEEGMDKCLARIAARLGLPAPDDIPHEKPSPAIAVSLTRANLAAIERAYAQDYSQFGYRNDANALQEAGVDSIIAEIAH